MRSKETTEFTIEAMATDNGSQPDFQIMTSLRYDPLLLESAENTRFNYDPTKATPFYACRYHRDKMLNAAKYFAWEKVVARLQGDEGLQWFVKSMESAVDNWMLDNHHDDGSSPSLRVCSCSPPTCKATNLELITNP